MPARPRVQWIVAGIVVLVVVGTAAAQLALLRAQPVAHGSTSWSRDPLVKCRQFEPTLTTTRCTEVDFAPGAPVGIGFSIRNNGLVPLTVVSVASLGAESPIMLAELHPSLPPVDAPYAIEKMRPFAPIELAPGEEATIYLVGTMRTCEAVRGYWRNGTGVRFDSARMTIRWLLLSTDVEMPLRDLLQVNAPPEHQCP